MSNYQEQIAHWRAQRQRQETEARLDEVRREYSEVQAARDEAYREGNAGDFDHYDRRCEELETEYLHSLPPDQQAAVSPQVRAFVQAWCRRYSSLRVSAQLCHGTARPEQRAQQSGGHGHPF